MTSDMSYGGPEETKQSKGKRILEVARSAFVTRAFRQATRDDVLDALDTLDADRNSSRPKGRREEETKDGGRDGGTGGVDLVAFIRLMRQRPANTAGK